MQDAGPWTLINLSGALQAWQHDALLDCLVALRGLLLEKFEITCSANKWQESVVDSGSPGGPELSTRLLFGTSR